MRKRWRWTIRWASVAIPLLVLPLIALQVDRASLLRMLTNLDYGWVAAGVAAGIAYQGFRTARFAPLLRVPVSIALFATLCLHGAMRKILPAWIGEGVGIWLFRSRHAVHPGAGSASLLLGRTLDLGLVFVVVLVLLAAGTHPAGLPGILIWGLFGVVAVAVVGLALIPVFDARFSPRWMGKTGWRGFLGRFLAEMAGSVSAARTCRIFLPTAISTLLMWLAMYFRHYAFVHALGFPLSPTDVAWMQLVVVPIQLLPIRGVADLGTHEAGWYAAASLVGLAAGDAALVALGTHMLAFLAAGTYFIAALGIIGFERWSRADDK